MLLHCRYVKFDTFHPAADAGLPVTRVISRVSLQNVLAKAAIEYGGADTILGSSTVASYSEVHGAGSNGNSGDSQGVSVTLEDGRVFTGDVLVGADGIWSKIRKQMVGESNVSGGHHLSTGMHKVAQSTDNPLPPVDNAQPSYSEYTCYTGISDFTPADIDVVSGAMNEVDFRLLVLNTEKTATLF